jgi:RNA chaperone Hfq
MTMSESSVCQKQFLSSLIADQSTVLVYLKNGVKLTGKIIGESSGAIFLSDPIPQMVYKSCVSTVISQSDIGKHNFK